MVMLGEIQAGWKKMASGAEGLPDGRLKGWVCCGFLREWLELLIVKSRSFAALRMTEVACGWIFGMWAIRFTRRWK
jgi:hypothetical protein